MKVYAFPAAFTVNLCILTLFLHHYYVFKLFMYVNYFLTPLLKRNVYMYEKSNFKLAIKKKLSLFYTKLKIK